MSMKGDYNDRRRKGLHGEDGYDDDDDDDELSRMLWDVYCIGRMKESMDSMFGPLGMGFDQHGAFFGGSSDLFGAHDPFDEMRRTHERMMMGHSQHLRHVQSLEHAHEHGRRMIAPSHQEEMRMETVGGDGRRRRDHDGGHAEVVMSSSYVMMNADGQTHVQESFQHERNGQNVRRGLRVAARPNVQSEFQTKSAVQVGRGPVHEVTGASTYGQGERVPIMMSHDGGDGRYGRTSGALEGPARRHMMRHGHDEHAHRGSWYQTSVNERDCHERRRGAHGLTSAVAPHRGTRQGGVQVEEVVDLTEGDGHHHGDGTQLYRHGQGETGGIQVEEWNEPGDDGRDAAASSSASAASARRPKRSR